MRLLFVSHSLPPEGRPMENVGGMQRVAIDLHDSLSAHSGADVRMLVLRSSWKETGYRTPLFLAKALREIRRLARAREIDAILFSSMLTATLTVPLKPLLKRNGIFAAAIVNGLDATTPTWPYPLLVRQTFKALDLILPISRATEDACALRGLDRSKSKVISLGIRDDRFNPDRDRSEARSELTRAHGNAKLILASVGRLVPRKGAAWFIANVLPLLPDDVLYLIAGDGPDRTRISEMITQYRLTSSAKLLGAVTDDELETLYHGADLFMMPNIPVQNDMEGFGLVMLEAGMCGLPTIASNIEGIADVIRDGENGHLVPAEDAGAFRDAIMRYYENPARLAPFSERARAYTTSTFGWAAVIEQYLSAIRSRLS
ncbi:MAG TPA: glycosyltransferase family 4 protein [Gemmatimonadaceae bacterium]